MANHKNELSSVVWGEKTDLELTQARLAYLAQELRSVISQDKFEANQVLSLMSQLQILSLEHQWKQQYSINDLQDRMESMSRVTLYLVSMKSRQELRNERIYQVLFASIVAVGSILFTGIVIR
jgi:hypothetical protein